MAFKKLYEVRVDLFFGWPNGLTFFLFAEQVDLFMGWPLLDQPARVGQPGQLSGQPIGLTTNTTPLLFISFNWI